MLFSCVVVAHWRVPNTAINAENASVHERSELVVESTGNSDTPSEQEKP